MTIEAAKLDSVIPYSAPSADVAVTKAADVQSTSTVDAAPNNSVDVGAITDAVQQIQAHLAALTDPPQFNVDYLSGLNVMTLRAASTGEVVFQIPGPVVVRLAQLIKEGVPMDSFGVLNAKA
jgi:uncharacterized FlaG/YvyC family protein